MGGDVGCWYQKGGIFQIFRRQLGNWIALVFFFSSYFFWLVVLQLVVYIFLGSLLKVKLLK